MNYMFISNNYVELNELYVYKQRNIKIISS